MTGRDPDVPPLLKLASRIDEGLPVDWDEAERGAGSDRERAVIAALRVLADVARVARRPQAAPQAPDGADGVAPRPLGRARLRARMPSTRFSPARVPPVEDSLVRWGPLTVLAPVGRGAFGTVFRARDALGREVALKLLSIGRDLAADTADRLIGETRRLARVTHDHVVTVYGVERRDSALGIWMEYIHGLTLEEELVARGPLSAANVVPIARTICSALGRLHAQGLLHRDLSSHNVMREAGGRIVLMDFVTGREPGVAAAGLGVPPASMPPHLAPELFDGRPATPATDVYSLGVLLNRLVTGRDAVTGTAGLDAGHAQARPHRARLAVVRPGLPQWFVHVVERAAATEPGDRYQTTRELDDALAAEGA